MKTIKVLFLLFVSIIIIPTIVKAEDCSIEDTIEISNIEIKNKSDNTIQKSNPIIINKKLSLDLKMKDIGDFIEYKIRLKNNSKEKYNLELNNTDSNYFKYYINGEDGINIINSNEEKDVILKIEYKEAIPDNLLNNKIYNENKNFAINQVNTNNSIIQELNNPKTYNLYMIIIFILFIVIFVLYRMGIKSKNIMIIIFTISIFLPISIYALCKYEIQIDMQVELVDEKTVYTININNNPLGYVILNEQINDSIIKYNSPEETNKNIFLKHKLENGIVKESYIGLIVSEDNASDKIYYLRGIANDTSVDNFISPYYEENVSIIKNIFGENSEYCSENSDKYICNKQDFYYCEASKKGSVFVGKGLWQCFVALDGYSGCTQD